MGLFKTLISKVKSGLTRTRNTLVGGLRSLLLGRSLSRELMDELEVKLIQADVGVKTARALRQSLQEAWERGEVRDGEQALAHLKSHIQSLWPAEDRSLKFNPQGPTVILVVGINGAGKTTSIAKIAKSLRDEGRSVLLAACDTFRAAAVEQLTIWSERLGVEVVRGQQGGDPAAVAYDAAERAIARDVDVLIVDTAGRLHTQKHLMEQLAKIHRVIERKIPGAPHETILVLDATTGQNAINQATTFAQATQVTGLFLAKLDGTARGGMVIAIREQLSIPVKFIGVGETPDDVEPFDPDAFVEALFTEG
ncbi:MAG: signal recognition particle-docking protein FtsY [Phycisphaeraceae bacterium]|nr:signal recognition particle-docking protein FtsY [Phycisphaeraceae bacterium]